MYHKIFSPSIIILNRASSYLSGDLQSMLMYRTLIARKIAINQSHPTRITSNYRTDREQALREREAVLNVSLNAH